MSEKKIRVGLIGAGRWHGRAGIKGFVDGMDMSRCEEVRLADNNGLYELHMHPGTGTIDFVDMFRRIEAAGFKGHYICAWAPSIKCFSAAIIWSSALGRRASPLRRTP